MRLHIVSILFCSGLVTVTKISGNGIIDKIEKSLKEWANKGKAVKHLTSNRKAYIY
jgi:hypothetical protein